MRVQFQGIPRPVLFDGCAELLDRLALLTQGWRWQAGEDDAPPDHYRRRQRKRLAHRLAMDARAGGL